MKPIKRQVKKVLSIFLIILLVIATPMASFAEGENGSQNVEAAAAVEIENDLADVAGGETNQTEGTAAEPEGQQEGPGEQQEAPEGQQEGSVPAEQTETPAESAAPEESTAQEESTAAPEEQSTAAPEGESQTQAAEDEIVPGDDDETQPAEEESTEEETEADPDVESDDLESDDVVFDKHNLILGDELGVNFKLELSEAAQADDAYMEFTITGIDAEDSVVPLHKAKKLSDGRFQFTYYIASVQMADTIKATYYYSDEDGELASVSEDYSVREYIETALEEDFGSATDELLKAIADYGYYAQLAVSENMGWTVGEDHEEMIHFTDDFDWSALSNYAIEENGVVDGIAKVLKRIALESRTQIELEIILNENYVNEAPAISVKDKAGKAVKVLHGYTEDGTYGIIIKNIGAHKLGEPYTITIDGKKVIKMSALSYAGEVLASEDTSDSLKDFAVALYNYYKATMRYRGQ